MARKRRDGLRILVDTSRFVNAMVSTESEPKVKDLQTGEQQKDPETGELIWQTEVNIFGSEGDGTGAAVLLVRTAGAKPSVKVGQNVVFEDLEAVPWVNGQRNGVAYRATSIKPATASNAKSAA